MQYELQYNGTAGFVDTPASKQRAIDEVRSGAVSDRFDDMLLLLRQRGSTGATWREIADELRLHHGQASGALSNLHRLGLVFMLRAKRNRCHPYVHADLRSVFTDEQRIDTPAQTRAGERSELLKELLSACQAATVGGWDDTWHLVVADIVDRIRIHDEQR